MVGRRRFFKVGLLGMGLLGAGGALYAISRDPASERATVLRGVISGLLAGALPAQEPARQAKIELTLQEVEVAIAGLAPSAQKELSQLFALLASAPGRYLAGIGSWTHATETEMASFLSTWRFHKLALFQVAYQGLHDLVTGTYYANSSTWPEIGYAGPLAL
jgi:hypothetical protein